MANKNEERSFLNIAREADKVRKNLLKAEQKLTAVQAQMAALDTKKQDAVKEVGDLDEELRSLKTEMEELI